MTIDVEPVRSDSPILNRLVGSNPLIHLDNTATTHTPSQVREVYDEFYGR